MKTTKAELTAENDRLRAELSALSFARSLRFFAPIAWTGGSRPRKPSELGRVETATRRALFREQVNAFRSYWGDYPNADTIRIFFRRASADAHATFRGAFNA